MRQQPQQPAEPTNANAADNNWTGEEFVEEFGIEPPPGGVAR